MTADEFKKELLLFLYDRRELAYKVDFYTLVIESGASRRDLFTAVDYLHYND